MKNRTVVMNSRQAASLCLAVLVAFMSTTVLGGGSLDHDSVALRIVDHDCCRVIVPSLIRRSAVPSPEGCSDTDIIDVLWCYTPAALAVADDDLDRLFGA